MPDDKWCMNPGHAVRSKAMIASWRQWNSDEIWQQKGRTLNGFTLQPNIRVQAQDYSVCPPGIFFFEKALTQENQTDRLKNHTLGSCYTELYPQNSDR